MWTLRASTSLRAFVRKKGVHGMHLEQPLACSKCSINVARLICFFYIAKTSRKMMHCGCMVRGRTGAS